MKKLKAILKLLLAKHWVVITGGNGTYTNIFYSDRYKYPSMAPSHHYADLAIKNHQAVIGWLRVWADVLERRLYNPNTYKDETTD